MTKRHVHVCLYKLFLHSKVQSDWDVIHNWGSQGVKQECQQVDIMIGRALFIF
jgi:hypothetical protein